MRALTRTHEHEKHIVTPTVTKYFTKISAFNGQIDFLNLGLAFIINKLWNQHGY